MAKPKSEVRAQDLSTPAWHGADVLVLSPTPTHPQDYGNRKRIFSVCSQLTERGARVTFLHYPTETEWRSGLPGTSKAMARAWFAYHTIPVTAPIHPPPRGAVHSIDEWWDDAIGGFVKWLFSVTSFDVFIVNYSWLSKAFEFAPAAVVKILDTHDRLADRHLLLRENGIESEYFYTTSEQEAIALRRADIVWAIKDQERSAFEALGGDALTLSHIDRLCSLPASAPDPDGYLRVGFIGARNNLNVKNFLEFLSTAIPVFERFFAPIKIIVGGSMCDWLPQLDQRFVEVMGCLRDVRELYRVVDVICIPMQFSTGAKIKTGEALAFGLPVVSLAHGFEGYISHHPLHGLSNFGEMAERLVDLAYDRRLLPELRKASVLAARATQASIVSTMERTWRAVRSKRRTIVYCVCASVFDETEPRRFAFLSTLQYLTRMGDVVVAVVAGPAHSLLDGEALLGRCRVVVDPDVISDRASLIEAEDRGFQVARLHDILNRFEQTLTIVDVICENLLNAGSRSGRVVLRTEMVAQTTALILQQQAIDRLFRNFAHACVMVPRHSELVTTIAATSAAKIVVAPCCWASAEVTRRLERRERGNEVAILANPRMHGLLVIARFLHRLGFLPVFVVPIGLETGSGAFYGDFDIINGPDYLSGIINLKRALPSFALDLSFGLPGIQYLREILMRLDIPTIAAIDRVRHASMPACNSDWRPHTYERLISQILAMTADHSRPIDGQRRFLKEELEGDAGWAWLRHYGFNEDRTEVRSAI